jgi:hypothetical protein
MRSVRASRILIQETTFTKVDDPHPSSQVLSQPVTRLTSPIQPASLSNTSIAPTGSVTISSCSSFPTPIRDGAIKACGASAQRPWTRLTASGRRPRSSPSTEAATLPGNQNRALRPLNSHVFIENACGTQGSSAMPSREMSSPIAVKSAVRVRTKVSSTARLAAVMAFAMSMMRE